MIELHVLCTLTSPFVSAASGLVIKDDGFLLVADDENHLVRYDRSRLVGERLEIFPGELPLDPKARKKTKPDFESLIDIPEQKKILVMPSGSRPQRMRGAWVNQRGELISHLDLTEFFGALSGRLAEINIEGGVAQGRELFLLQRGNGERGENGLLRAEFSSDDRLRFQSFTAVTLPSIEEVSCTFTDACPYRGNILFLAVAEASESTYLDGEVKGAILGEMSPEGKVLWHERLCFLDGSNSKPEGIWWDETASRFFVVTDDDDRTQPSKIMWGQLP